MEDLGNWNFNSRRNSKSSYLSGLTIGHDKLGRYAKAFDSVDPLNFQNYKGLLGDIGKRPELAKVLNCLLVELIENPEKPPYGSFFETEILRSKNVTVILSRATSESLSDDKYIPGNIYDQILLNISESEIIVELFEQDASDRLGQRPQPLKSKNRHFVLAQGEQLYVPHDKLTYRISEGQKEKFVLILKSVMRRQYNWYYDRKDLTPAYQICNSANITQTGFLLKVMSNLRQRTGLDVVRQLTSDKDPSIAWAALNTILKCDFSEGYSLLLTLCKEQGSPQQPRATHLLDVISKRISVKKGER